MSAAKKAEPKHPAKQVTNAFRRRGAMVYATLGETKCHRRGAPNRGWPVAQPLPLYERVEQFDKVVGAGGRA